MEFSWKPELGQYNAVVEWDSLTRMLQSRSDGNYRSHRLLCIQCITPKKRKKDKRKKRSNQTHISEIIHWMICSSFTLLPAQSCSPNILRAKKIELKKKKKWSEPWTAPLSWRRKDTTLPLLRHNYLGHASIIFSPLCKECHTCSENSWTVCYIQPHHDVSSVTGIHALCSPSFLSHWLVKSKLQGTTETHFTFTYLLLFPNSVTPAELQICMSERESRDLSGMCFLWFEVNCHILGITKVTQLFQNIWIHEAGTLMKYLLIWLAV